MRASCSWFDDTPRQRDPARGVSPRGMTHLAGAGEAVDGLVPEQEVGGHGPVGGGGQGGRAGGDLRLGDHEEALGRGGGVHGGGVHDGGVHDGGVPSRGGRHGVSRGLGALRLLRALGGGRSLWNHSRAVRTPLELGNTFDTCAERAAHTLASPAPAASAGGLPLWVPIPPVKLCQ